MCFCCLPLGVEASAEVVVAGCSVHFALKHAFEAAYHAGCHAEASPLPCTSNCLFAHFAAMR
jgi:hypothetical protein